LLEQKKQNSRRKTNSNSFLAQKAFAIPPKKL